MTIKGYRTILWNLLNAVPAVMTMAETQYAVPEDWMPWWMAVFITVNLILRVWTRGPVGKSDA